MLNCKLLAVAAPSILLLGACASKPPAPDTTPLLRSAEIVSTVSSSGIKGLFANEGTKKVTTFVSDQRIDDDFEMTGTIMSRFGGKRKTSHIVRLNQGIEWDLDHKTKTYQECAINGCSALPEFRESVFAQEHEQDAEPAACVIRLKDNTFDLIKTGQQRLVNGFQADEYSLEWRVTVEDNIGGTSVNLFAVTLWTTEENSELSEALTIQRAFDDRYLKAKLPTLTNNIDKAFPSQALALLERYFLDSMDDAQFKKFKQQISRAITIEGFPVSRKVKWDARGNTCAEPKQPEEQEDNRLNTGSFKGLLASVGKQVLKQEVDRRVEEKKRELDMAPVLLFIEDVNSVKVTEVRESQLSVPAKYKLVNRR